MGQALKEEFDDPDFPLILEELRKEKKGVETEESEKSDLLVSDQQPLPIRDQALVSPQTACQSTSLQPVNRNHGVGNADSKAGEDLIFEHHDDLDEQTTYGEPEVLDERENQHLEMECIDLKFTDAAPAPLYNHFDNCINGMKDVVPEVPSKPELMPVIKVERCDDMLDASDCHKLNTGALGTDRNAIRGKKSMPRNVESLWKTCRQKIKKARSEKAKPKPKIAVRPPISELEQFDFYQKKQLCKKKLEKKKAILEEDGKKEHTIENLLFLKNMERRLNNRIMELKLPLPKVKCQLCHEVLSRKRFEHAFLIHGIEYQNTCPVCLEKNFTNLEGHFRTAHFKDVPLSCHLCPAVYYSAKELRKHVVCHQTVDPLTCAVCEFHFASKQELETHHSQHHVSKREVKEKKEKKPKLPMLFEGTCETCGHLLRGRSADDLKNRIFLHKQKQHTEKLKCPLCDRKFVLYTLLSKHCLRAHTPEDQRPFICPFENCGKGFKTGDNLKSHQVYHKPPRFKCEKCNKSFYWAEVWRKHKCPLA